MSHTITLDKLQTFALAHTAHGGKLTAFHNTSMSPRATPLTHQPTTSGQDL
jgi:hypothetical protein